MINRNSVLSYPLIHGSFSGVNLGIAILLLALLPSIKGSSQCPQVVTRTLSSFSSNPSTFGDGINYDDDAFEKAALWFNNRVVNGTYDGAQASPLNVDYAAGCTGELIIDYYRPGTTIPAVYKVGKQYGPGDTYYNTETGGERKIPTLQQYFTAPGQIFPFLKRGNDIFTIRTDVKGLNIHSSNLGQKVKILFGDNFYFGAFCPPDYQYYQIKERCYNNSNPNNPADFCYSTSAVPVNLPYGLDASNTSPVSTATSTNWPGHGCNSCNPSAPSSCGCEVTLANQQFIGMTLPETTVSFLNTSSNIVPLPLAVNDGYSSDPKTYCFMGTFFVIKGKDVTLKDIEIDGNIQSCIYGRFAGDVGGVQLSHSAIVIMADGTGGGAEINMNTKIENVYAHHLGEDGLKIAGAGGTSATDMHNVPTLVRVTNCDFNDNLRQGISWSCGKDIKMDHVNCIGNGEVGNMYGNPGGAMDLEPDDYQICEDGEFNYCVFDGNKGWGALRNDGFNSLYYVRDMRFNHCEFRDNSGDGVYIRGAKMVFNTCNFYALVKSVYQNNNSADSTTFDNCTFMDHVIGSTPNSSDDYLIRTNGANSTYFKKCTMIVNKINREIFNSTQGFRPSSEWPIFENCDFIYNNTGNGSVGILSGARFRKQNKFIAIGPQHCDGRILQLSNVLVEGSADNCEPTLLEIEGKIQVQIRNDDVLVSDNNTPPCLIGLQQDNLYIGNLSSSSTAGHAIMRLRNGAILRGINQFPDGFTPPSNCPPVGFTHKLYIGEKAKVDILEGCGLEAVNTEINGSLLIHQGAFLHQNGAGTVCSIPPTQILPCPITGPSTSKLFISKFCNPSFVVGNYSVAIPPNYHNSSDPFCTTIGMPFNVMGCFWAGPLTGGVCAMGQKTEYTTQASCVNDNYPYIASGDVFDITYNINHVACNGMSTGSVSINAINNFNTGANYQYQVNGGAWQSATNTIGNLAAGVYTIHIKDVSLAVCNTKLVTMVVEITEPPTALSINATTTSILCNGGLSDITVSASGGTIGLGYQYRLNAGPYGSANTFTGNLAGTYTLTVKDANNCTASTVVTISQPSMPQWVYTSFKNIDCNNNPGEVELLASGGTGTIEYSIDGTSWFPVNNTTTNHCHIPFSSSGNYTVTARDANNCTKTFMFHAGQPDAVEHCCASASNPNAGSNLVNTQNMILYTNPSASDIIAVYGNTINNRSFYIAGTFTIDNNITFNGCTFYFTPNAIIQYNNNATYQLTLNTCNASPSCDWWGGFLALNSANKLKIQGGSYHRSTVGIHAINNAVIEVAHANFYNNWHNFISLGNMTLNPYPGYIKGNTFACNTILPTPDGKTKLGISVVSVKDLTIGGLGTGEGNTFSGMETGIWMTPNTANLNPTLRIYNNAFNNIKANYSASSTPEADLINNCYQTYKGAAIMAYYGGPPAQNIMHVEVKNSSPASASIAFTQCDKGIVTVQSSLITENLYMDNVPMGMMNYNIIGTVNSGSSGGANQFDIQHNKIENGYLGIQLAGAASASILNDNKIECTLFPSGVEEPPTGGLGISFIWPKGIDLSDYLNTNIQDVEVMFNDITIPHYAGIGINSLQGGSGLAINDNTVDLTTTDASILACAGATNLFGISSTEALGTRIHRNNITANTFSVTPPTNMYMRIDAAGILLDHGQNQALGCNAISGSRFGLLAYSENNTNNGNELLVQGNTVLNADAGWVFRHLATEGTLGNVGDIANDNNNLFPTLPGGAKVFKFCLGADPLQIFTTSINQFTESLSENMNTQVANDCEYLIQNNPGATLFDIANDCGGLQIGPWNGGEIPITEALAIATNTKVYVEFPTLAHWYDSKRLYEYLTENSALLNAYITLDSFYAAMTNDAIARIEATDQQLTNLIQSFDMYTPAQRDALLAYIEGGNESINNTEIHNANEQEINRIYLDLVRFGIDSMSETDKEFISSLAPQCPYIAGSAVFKARSLNLYLQPGAMYNDMKTCNDVGVYRQEDGTTSVGSHHSLITMENESLSQIKYNPVRSYLNRSEVFVYPVPTKDYVDVNYVTDNDATFTIYSSLGEKVITQKLFKENTKQRIELDRIANGVYNYEVLFANKLKSIGKLTVVN